MNDLWYIELHTDWAGWFTAEEFTWDLIGRKHTQNMTPRSMETCLEKLPDFMGYFPHVRLRNAADWDLILPWELL